MSINPIEIPTGAVRYNTDSNKMEVYIGDTWMEVSVSAAGVAGGRGVFTSRYTPSNNDVLDYIKISSGGTAVDFGNVTSSRSHSSTGSSRTRGIIMGGATPSMLNTVEQIEIASAANATDFGDLTQARTQSAGASNNTRVVLHGGQTPSNVNTIDFGTIDIPRDFIDFGDARAGIAIAAPCESPTRAVFTGGEGALENQGHITFASTGDEVSFGDILGNSGGSLRYGRGASNGVRGLVFGGLNPSPTKTNEIMQVNIPSLGNAVHFGDMSGYTGRSVGGTTGDSIRAVYAGGDDGTNNITTVDSVLFATMGNTVDFGDLTVAGGGINGLSDCHGGL
mgnify:CR=1 FL=1